MTASKRLSDEEWLRRYNEYFRKHADWEGDFSEFQLGFEIEAARNEFDDEPEQAAREEMTYWETEDE